MSSSNEVLSPTTTEQPDHLSIDQYAVIGNMSTCCLVGIDASIDWCCFPNFNSPSVFAKILDIEKGGYFSLKPSTTEFIPKQHYWPDTNVLITKFLMDDGVGQVTDFMPVENKKVKQEVDIEGTIIRRIEVVHGVLNFVLECFPAFNYAKDPHSVKVNEEGTRAIFKSEKMTLELQSSLPCLKIADNGVVGDISLNSSTQDQKKCTFILRQVSHDELEPVNCLQIVDKSMVDTIQYWQKWANRISYQGRWREKVLRSALVMKLMTFDATGAIVSSPSTSLPKVIGGSRNYDYRFTWIRDACFALHSFLQLGLSSEATNLMSFIEQRILAEKPKQLSQTTTDQDNQYTALSLGAPLSVMYNIDGSSKSVEEHAESLEHLNGYKNSRPVRIGNAASTHLEFDIFGELLDVVYQFNMTGAPISYEFWTRLRHIVNWVCDHWAKPDASIWEIRGVNQHYVHSKVMCWVAIDRALKLSLNRSFPSDRDRWLKVRDEIFEDVMKNGWNEEIGSFVQCYGSKTLDVSLLILPVVDFLSPQDPRIISTIQAINRSPKKGGLVSSTLVYRYDTSSIGSHEGAKEGTFNMCTMWLIQALTLAGKTETRMLHQAQLLFEQMLSYSNRVGLFSEQTSFSGKSLGNFPHCNTHSALVAAAISLNKALGK